MALFGVLILTAVISVADDYNKDYSDVAGGSLALEKFNNSISDVEQNSQDLKERFDKGSVWSAIAGVVVEGIFGIAKDMFLMILTPFDVLSDIMGDVLHIPTFVTAIILGLLIIGVMFAIWRLLKIGD